MRYCICLTYFVVKQLISGVKENCPFGCPCESFECEATDLAILRELEELKKLLNIEEITEDIETLEEQIEANNTVIFTNYRSRY